MKKTNITKGQLDGYDELPLQRTKTEDIKTMADRTVDHYRHLERTRVAWLRGLVQQLRSLLKRWMGRP